MIIPKQRKWPSRFYLSSNWWLLNKPLHSIPELILSILQHQQTDKCQRSYPWISWYKVCITSTTEILHSLWTLDKTLLTSKNCSWNAFFFSLSLSLSKNFKKRTLLTARISFISMREIYHLFFFLATGSDQWFAIGYYWPHVKFLLISMISGMVWGGG